MCLRHSVLNQYPERMDTELGPAAADSTLPENAQAKSAFVSKVSKKTSVVATILLASGALIGTARLVDSNFPFQRYNSLVPSHGRALAKSKGSKGQSRAKPEKQPSDTSPFYDVDFDKREYKFQSDSELSTRIVNGVIVSPTDKHSHIGALVNRWNYQFCAATLVGTGSAVSAGNSMLVS